MLYLQSLLVFFRGLYVESVANLVIRCKTLFANVSDCAQTGMNTFRKAGEKMALIASMAHELAKDDGIVSGC